MKVLIANPGSTSYKCKLYETTSSGLTLLFQATVERIGDVEGIYTYSFEGAENSTNNLEIKDYFSAVQLTLDTLKTVYPLENIEAVGFKTVQAKGVTGCVELTNDVLDAMKDYRSLAPVHTDVYITAISVFQKLLKTTPLLGLFETHFHVNIPEEAYLYGIPYEYYVKHGIRKYGFHGASHRYIGQRAKELFNADKVISCHLGGSSSVCAIKDGWSIDVSMGMSPQSGLLNSNRVGDLDAYALLYLMEKENLSIDDARDILMSKSGLLGLSDGLSDFRDIETKMNAGDEKAKRAFNTFSYYAKRYIGEYLTALNGADCIAFTAGAGQKSPLLRKTIIGNLENLGIILDEQKNNDNPTEGIISAENSKIVVAVIPTNEELIVATEVEKYLRDKK
jgi:acetate kinase